ncbi:MAG: hypothetical protein J6S21_07910, partial [Victivallales bacterium]|nr:hypothetical protein [Victivallales bacterium]
RNYVRGDGHPDCLERGDREAFWSGYYVARLSYLHDFYSGNPERQGNGIVSVASAHCIGSALPQSPLIDIGDRGTEHSALLTMSAGDVLKAFEPIFTAVQDLSGQVPHEVKPPPLQLVSSTYSLRERTVSGHAGQSSACREMLSGRVPPGGSASCALTVLEGGDLLFALSGLPPEARCRLIGGDGAEMEFEVVDGGASGADGLRIAAVSNAVPGEYLLEVADGDGGGGFNFLASVAGEEEAFVLEVPFAAADAGEIFVTAAVSGSVPGRTHEEIRLFCHWRKSGGELWRVNQVPPEEFGDGSFFAGSFPVEDEGLYECAVVAELVLPDGASVFRTATFEVVLARSRGEIMQEGIVLKMPDGDGDGMAECLLAEVPVRVEQGGGYLLRGTLVTEDGVLAGRGAAWLEAPEAGEYQVNLEFSGGEIYASGVREYLLLEDISLERKVDGGSAPAAVADSGVSVVCSAVEFQHQPVTAAAVVAEKSYECTDEWGWGLGGVQLEVELEGDGISAVAQYSVYAQLLSGDGRVCAEALCSELRSAGETGRAYVTLDFAGRDIATAGQDGPYHLECITVWAAAAPEKRYILRTDYRSGAYSALDFAMPVKLPASAGSRDGVMVTERRKLEDGLWAMTVELTCGGDDYAFTAPFRLMPENPYAAEYRDFSFADGEDGVLDITLEMLEVLGRTGNGNRLLEPGETISLEVLCRWDGAEELVPSLGVALLAGRVPEYVGLLSHQDDGKRHEYDNDSDGVLDAAEVITGWNKWLQADSGDGTLLEAVDILRQGGAYRWTDGVFVPR